MSATPAALFLGVSGAASCPSTDESDLAQRTIEGRHCLWQRPPPEAGEFNPMFVWIKHKGGQHHRNGKERGRRSHVQKQLARDADLETKPQRDGARCLERQSDTGSFWRDSPERCLYLSGCWGEGGGRLVRSLYDLIKTQKKALGHKSLSSISAEFTDLHPPKNSRKTRAPT